MTFDYLPMALLVFEIISTFIGRRFKWFQHLPTGI
jgi:hypothetical protein